MKSALPALAVVLAVVLVPAAASRPVSSAPVKKARTFKTRAISFLAADGTRVAAVTSGPITDKVFRSYCERVGVWNVAKKTSKPVLFKTGVCPHESAVNKMLGLAVAGKRIAWLGASGGNSLEMGIGVVTLGAKKGRVVTAASASNQNGAEEYPDGTYVGNLAGKGSLLAFNYWGICTAVPLGGEDDMASCGQPAPGGEEVEFLTDQQLRKVVGKKSAAIAAAPNRQMGTFDYGDGGSTDHALPAVWVDGGRILVQQSDTQLTIYSAGGSVLKQITAVPSTTFTNTVLQGSQLLTSRSNNTLALYNAHTGAFVKTVRVKGNDVELRDLQSGLAVYLDYNHLHVVRLADGKRFTLTLSENLVDARIEAAGLYYAYNVGKGAYRGRVAFVPFAKVVKKLH